jgi:hypothetical protein
MDDDRRQQTDDEQDAEGQSIRVRYEEARNETPDNEDPQTGASEGQS